MFHLVQARPHILVMHTSSRVLPCSFKHQNAKTAALDDVPTPVLGFNK